VDEDRAGRVRVGRDVKVDPGADVRILVPGRGLARIPDGARLSGRKAVVVGEGEDILIE
jgi:hypothetical protein